MDLRHTAPLVRFTKAEHSCTLCGGKWGGASWACSECAKPGSTDFEDHFDVWFNGPQLGESELACPPKPHSYYAKKEWENKFYFGPTEVEYDTTNSNKETPQPEWAVLAQLQYHYCG